MSAPPTTPRPTLRLTLRTPHADDEAVQLTAQEVPLLLQLLDALLQPGILLQGDVQVSSQVRDQDERAVLRMGGLLHHGLCKRGTIQKQLLIDKLFFYTLLVQLLLFCLYSCILQVLLCFLSM